MADYFFKDNLDVDAALLVSKLHRRLLCLLCHSAGRHFEGLRQAAVFHRATLGNRLSKKLIDIDTTHNICRHITSESSLCLMTELNAIFPASPPASGGPLRHRTASCDSSWSGDPSTDANNEMFKRISGLEASLSCLWSTLTSSPPCSTASTCNSTSVHVALDNSVATGVQHSHDDRCSSRSFPVARPADSVPDDACPLVADSNPPQVSTNDLDDNSPAVVASLVAEAASADIDSYVAFDDPQVAEFDPQQLPVDDFEDCSLAGAFHPPTSSFSTTSRSEVAIAEEVYINLLKLQGNILNFGSDCKAVNDSIAAKLDKLGDDMKTYADNKYKYIFTWLFLMNRTKKCGPVRNIYYSSCAHIRSLSQAVRHIRIGRFVVSPPPTPAAAASAAARRHPAATDYSAACPGSTLRLLPIPRFRRFFDRSGTVSWVECVDCGQCHDV